MVVEKGKLQPQFCFNRSNKKFILNTNSNVVKVFLLIGSVMLLLVSCEDPLDSVVTKKDSNDLFELTLEA